MKKFRRLLCVAAVLLVGTVAASADPLDFKNAVGVFLLGNVSATEPAVRGIQYQRWLTDRWGFQTEGFITYNRESYADHSPSYDFSFSAEPLLKLYETPKGYRFASTLYAWGLVGYHGFNDLEYNNTIEQYEDTGFQSDVMLGIGFGFDVMLLNHISIPFQFGFEGEFPNDVSAGFCLGVGVRYKF